MTERGRFLLVRLEPELHHSRQAGIFSAICLIPGVEAVTDMSVVSQATLDVLLLPPEATISTTTSKRAKKSKVSA